MPDISDISQITLPNGTTYNFKDLTARSSIPTKLSDLTNDTNFVTASFSGTSLVLVNASSVQQAEEVSF